MFFIALETSYLFLIKDPDNFSPDFLTFFYGCHDDVITSFDPHALPARSKRNVSQNRPFLKP